MSTEEMNDTQGRTTINPGVLVEIAKLTTLGVTGVTSMAQGPQPVNNLFSKSRSSGIKIEVENNTVYVDLYLVLSKDVDLFKTSKEVQEKVSRSIIEMVGMDVGRINVHIEDIAFQ